MKDIEFANWLMDVDGRDKRQTSDNISRARRVEEAFTEYLGTDLNLDTEYRKDRCNSVLDMLSFEYASEIPGTVNLPKDKNGLSSLRTAINKYIKFSSNAK